MASKSNFISDDDSVSSSVSIRDIYSEDRLYNITFLSPSDSVKEGSQNFSEKDVLGRLMKIKGN